MKTLEKIFPWGVLTLGLLYVGSMMFNSPATGKKGFNLAGYELIPVLDGGRFKPIGSFARSTLTIISGKQTFIDKDNTRQPAIKWLLDVMSSFDLDEDRASGPALDHKVFRIENEEVLSFLGLEPRSGLRYSLDEFLPHFKQLWERAAKSKEKKNKDLFETKLFELVDHLTLFQQVAYKNSPATVVLAMRGKDEWMPLGKLLGPDIPLENLKQIPSAYIHLYLLDAYRRNDPENFNMVLEKAQEILKKKVPTGGDKIEFEVFFNRFEPFHQAAVLYVFAFILGCLSWLFWFRSLNLAAFLLAGLAFAVHTWALLARMYIQGRPPVTNLYSSAIFIGWGCIGVCLVIEWLYRNSIPTVVGSALAAITAGIIAHYLSLSGDTMTEMEPVLDTNFWLATHVTCVTLGYTATFVAGFLGIGYVILGLLTPILRGNGATLLAKMIYGVVCFATLLSFTGTVLGGIWADQSWGRFWGWDPKENGALLIVIWNALFLHARWAGLVKQRGLAQLTIAGNIVTAWSWFGTNMLGVGLHAYGFMPAAVTWLIVFVITQLAMIGLGFIPQRFWMSFQKEPPRPAAPSGISDLPRLPSVSKTSITASS